MVSFVSPAGEGQQRIERTDLELVGEQGETVPGNRDFRLVLGQNSDFDLGIDHLIRFGPTALQSTALLELATADLIVTDQFGLAELSLNELFFLFHSSVWISTRELPRMVESRLAICSKVLDLQEMELAIFILQEVTDEHVHGSLVLRINIHLGEDFVN